MDFTKSESRQAKIIHAKQHLLQSGKSATFVVHAFPDSFNVLDTIHRDLIDVVVRYDTESEMILREVPALQAWSSLLLI